MAGQIKQLPARFLFTRKLSVPAGLAGRGHPMVNRKEFKMDQEERKVTGATATRTNKQPSEYVTSASGQPGKRFNCAET